MQGQLLELTFVLTNANSADEAESVWVDNNGTEHV